MFNIRKSCSKHAILLLRRFLSGAKSAFAMVFDIDGVIVQGHRLIPCAPEAFQLLSKHEIPYAFLTNSDANESMKAEELSKKLNVQIDPKMVISAHTPLRLLKSFHSKRLLAFGQTPYLENAKSAGFTDVCTVSAVMHVFPELCILDVNKRKALEHKVLNGMERDLFRKIDGLLFIGVPINWEEDIQIALDAIATNGYFNRYFPHSEVKQLPVIASNYDIIWKSSAVLPRIGHGSFLSCVEHIYKKVTGLNLQYTFLTGKPYTVTYQYVESILKNACALAGKGTLERLYFVGDNPDADIKGANLYQNYISSRMNELHEATISPVGTHIQSMNKTLSCRSAISILVRTGVYQKGNTFDHKTDIQRLPSLETENVLEAVKSVIDIEMRRC